MNPIPDLLYDWRRGVPLMNCVGCGMYLRQPVRDENFTLYSGARPFNAPFLELPKHHFKTSQTPGGPISLELHRKMRSRVATVTTPPPPPPQMENITEKPPLQLDPSPFLNAVTCGHGRPYRKHIPETFGNRWDERKPPRRLKTPIVNLCLAT
jgi:hypothetical protein